jgi:hypothetical protein
VAEEEFTGFAASPDATLAVLAHVNAVESSAWELAGKLTGGYQAGAWRLMGADGTKAVLKWWDQPWWAKRVLEAAPLIEDIRRQGYPTPAWLAVGVTPDDHPYEVQELVPGVAPEGLDLHVAKHVVDLVLMQRRMRLATDVNWSQYVMSTVFDDPDGRKGRLAAMSQELAGAVQALELLVARDSELHLSDQEMVHGDMNVSNLLRVDDHVTGVVDIEAIGRGSAAFDLLTPVRQARLWDGDEEAVNLLEQTALEHYGAATVRVVAACTILDILTFGANHYPKNDLDQIAIKANGWVDHLDDFTS